MFKSNFWLRSLMRLNLSYSITLTLSEFENFSLRLVKIKKLIFLFSDIPWRISLNTLLFIVSSASNHNAILIKKISCVSNANYRNQAVHLNWGEYYFPHHLQQEGVHSFCKFYTDDEMYVPLYLWGNILCILFDCDQRCCLWIDFHARLPHGLHWRTHL